MFLFNLVQRKQLTSERVVLPFQLACGGIAKICHQF